MPYCRHCGAAIDASDTFCGKCGRTQATGEGLRDVGSGNIAEARVEETDVLISPTKIVVLSIISFGIYPFYWFYLTWKHYRDHTKSEAYPVWHAFAVNVPIYGLFRTHAHVRSYKELMEKARIATSLSPGLSVVLIAFVNVLGWLSGGISWNTEISMELAVVSTALTLLAIGASIGLVLQIQDNLNKYWQSTSGGKAVKSHITVGEVIVCLLGIIAWIFTIVSLAGWEPSYVGGNVL